MRLLSLPSKRWVDGMHTKRTFGWDIYTIWCQLPFCQERGILFFDAIHKFYHNYLVILFHNSRRVHHHEPLDIGCSAFLENSFCRVTMWRQNRSRDVRMVSVH